MTDVAFSRATLLSNRPMCDLTKREAERGVLAATSWAVPLRIQISGTPFTPLRIPGQAESTYLTLHTVPQRGRKKRNAGATSSPCVHTALRTPQWDKFRGCSIDFLYLRNSAAVQS